MIGRWLYLWYRRILAGLPSCVRDITIAWWKNFNAPIDGGGTYPYIEEQIGTRVDTVYYGQYLDSGGVSGLLDFDGSDDYVQYPLMTIGVNETITFSLYRKINDYTSDSGIFMFGDQTSNMIKCTLIDTDIHISTDTFPNVVKYSVDGLTETELICVVTKVGNTITSFTVNGNALSQTPSSVWSGIGTNSFIGSSGVVLANNVLIYNVTIGSIFNTVGYPGGNLDPAWVDTIGSDDGIVSGSPTITSTSSVINFYRTSGTFDYIDPSDGTLVEGVSIPGTGLYTIPTNGICEIVTSDGSEYPVCERAGTVLHDTTENSKHLLVTTPSWSESLYGSDYLNQCGFLDKELSDQLGYDWESTVNTVQVALDDDTLVPLGQWDFSPLIDSEDESITDSGEELIYAKDNT